MKTVLVLAGLLLINICSKAQNADKSESICPSQTQANKILGQPAKFTESSLEKKNNINQFKCTYTAVDKDSRGRLGHLYYMAETYPSSKAAHDTLAYYHAQNNRSPGWKIISGIGDEGIIHTDGSNFQLLIVRKDAKMIRVKVNKITSYTPSIDTMKEIAKELLN